MAFDVEKMAAFSIAAIKAFATEHENEAFYAFAIDANMLCMNSEECIAATLRQYQEAWNCRTRELGSMDEMTEEDHQEEEFLLGLEQRCRGLDRNDADACLAVINKNRARLREKGCEWTTPEGIRTLRENTGDWDYQGFAELGGKCGFDQGLYNDHYEAAGESEDGHAPDTEYARAMASLVEALIAASAFACLKRTGDFKATWVDHAY